MRLFNWHTLVFLFCILAFQTIKGQTAYWSHQKDRLEWVFPKAQHTVDSTSPYLQEILKISEGVLNELESNLVYKTSDDIHLIGFLNWQEYVAYCEKTQENSENTSIEGLKKRRIYYPVYVGSNLSYALPEIKRGISTQFLREYLLGFSYTEKLNPLRNYNIPEWLVEGFIGYFSDGINRDEFLRFKILAENGRFRNINYIPKVNRELFGKVIWYWFENKKGKDVNSVFWQLLKRAHNFEKTFRYNFDIRFGDWLKMKISSIESSSLSPSEYADFQVPLKLGNIKAIHPSVASNNDFRITYSDGQGIHSIVSNSTKNKTLEYSKDLKLTLGKTKTHLFKNGNYYRIYHNEGCWFLKHPKSAPLPLSNNGVYSFVFSDDNSVYINQSLEGFETLFRIHEDKPSLDTIDHFQSYWGRHDMYLKSKNDFYYFIDQRISKDTSQTLFIHRQLGSTDTLHQVLHNVGYSSIRDFIVESDNHISYVHNQGWHSGIVHVRTNEPFKTVGTKGLFYQQSYLLNTDSICEVYWWKGAIKINYIPRGSQILDQDTITAIALNGQIYRDTGRITDPANKTYPRSSIFISPFAIKQKVDKSHLLTYSKKNNWLKEPFQPWFYPFNGQLYLSNKELDIPYSQIINPQERYNSPLTLFYSIEASQVFNDRSVGMLFFTNYNRRRIGMQISKSFRYKGYSNKFNATYRLRQFNLEQEQRKRERSAFIGYSLGKQMGMFQSNSTFSFSRNQIISINSRPELTNIELKNIDQVQASVSLSYTKSSINSEIQYILSNSNGMSIGILRSNIPYLISSAYSNTKFTSKWKGLKYLFSLKSQYSISETNTSILMGGSSGWFSERAFTDDQWEKRPSNSSPLIGQQLPIRGVLVGSRMGNSFVAMQQNLAISPLSIFPGTIHESRFWKSLEIYAFSDVGTAFYGSTPKHELNPYNVLIYSTPNYTITANTQNNPWVSGYGMGIEMSIWSIPFRIERAWGKVGDNSRLPVWLISLGKLF